MKKKTIKGWAIVGKRTRDLYRAYPNELEARTEKDENSIFHGRDVVIPCTIIF